MILSYGYHKIVGRLSNLKAHLFASNLEGESNWWNIHSFYKEQVYLVVAVGYIALFLACK
jgi:hypothetical protein